MVAWIVWCDERESVCKSVAPMVNKRIGIGVTRILCATTTCLFLVAYGALHAILKDHSSHVLGTKRGLPCAMVLLFRFKYSPCLEAGAEDHLP